MCFRSTEEGAIDFTRMASDKEDLRERGHPNLILRDGEDFVVQAGSQQKQRMEPWQSGKELRYSKEKMYMYN